MISHTFRPITFCLIFWKLLGSNEVTRTKILQSIIVNDYISKMIKLNLLIKQRLERKLYKRLVYQGMIPFLKSSLFLVKMLISRKIRGECVANDFQIFFYKMSGAVRKSTDVDLLCKLYVWKQWPDPWLDMCQFIMIDPNWKQKVSCVK